MWSWKGCGSLTTKALAGGGVGASNFNLLEIEFSEVVGNEIQLAPGHVNGGGGLYSESSTNGSVNIFESAFFDNGCLSQAAADCVGGLRIHETSGVNALLMVNSTVSGNEGHGLSFGEAPGHIVGSTIYGNSGYGIHVFDTGLVPRGVSAEITIFANSGIQDCFLFAGEWDFAGGHNLSSDNSCTLQPAQGDLINTDPDLHPLGHHQPPPGRALAHHPRWLSPVIDAGIAGLVFVDQEGYPRGEDGDIDPGAEYDIGSIEALECEGLVLPWYQSQTISLGIYEACQTILLGPDLVVSGVAAFVARDSVEFFNGVEVSAASVAAFGLARDAASTYVLP